MSKYNPASLPEGGTFHGRYQIVRCIKAGGMGAVYEVVHLETRRRRALKVMLPSMVANAEMRERFKLEATVAADIDSDHIVETFDAGVDPETGAPFLVMELLRGEDLAAVLVRRGRLPADEIVQILAQAAKALDKTHAAGIVHRDLKPDNLFLARRDDDPPRLKILDFGIAKVVAQATQAQTMSIGSPLYMAPEQIKGTRISPQTDLYALGQVAYQLLVGEPYWAEDLKVLAAIYPLLLRVGQGPTESAATRALRRREVTLTPAFEAWFVRATAMEPEARFERATAMIAALAEALEVTSPQSRAVAEGQARVEMYSAPALPAPSEAMAAVSGLPGAGTAAPITSDRVAPLPARPRRLPVLVAAGLLVAVALALTVMAVVRRAPEPAGPRDEVGAAVRPPPLPAVVPDPTAAPPVVEPTAAPAVVAATSSATAPSATTVTTVTARAPVTASAASPPPAPPKPPGKHKDRLGF